MYTGKIKGGGGRGKRKKISKSTLQICGFCSVQGGCTPSLVGSQQVEVLFWKHFGCCATSGEKAALPGFLLAATEPGEELTTQLPYSLSSHKTQPGGQRAWPWVKCFLSPTSPARDQENGAAPEPPPHICPGTLPALVLPVLWGKSAYLLYPLQATRKRDSGKCIRRG